MALFTSKRERRLWVWTVTVLAAIYSTAGLAGTLARRLGESELLGLSFLAAFLIVIASVVGIGLRRQPKPRELWVVVGVIAIYGMIIVRMGVGPAERTHLFEYGFLAVLIHQALLERRNRASVPVPAIFAALTAGLAGWGDELIQAWLPNRVYDVRDVLVNGLAALVAITASSLLGRLGRLDIEAPAGRS